MTLKRLQICCAESFRKIHSTHNGTEFCATIQVTINAREFNPCFTLIPEGGDADSLVEKIEASENEGALHLCRSASAHGPDEISYTILERVRRCTLSTLAELYTVCKIMYTFPA